jgi:hypothetical protein
MIHSTKETPSGRGCGERKRDAIYLCLGIGSDGELKVEDLVIDPVRIWEFGWQRGFSIFEASGVNHVVIFVGKQYYPSPWDFIEEARRYGVSRNVRNNFPIERLTPGKSVLFFAHMNAWPKFDYVANTHSDDCFVHNIESGVPEWGYHNPIINEIQLENIYPVKEPCAFTLRDLAVLHHPDPMEDDTPYFKIEMPSFDYYITPPLGVAGENFDPSSPPQDLEWEVGVFWRCPLSHIEARDYLNPESKERVEQAGYEVQVLDY